MVFNAIFNNISSISWRPVLLVEETGVSRENQFSNFSAISWREQVHFQWNDDEVRFELDQHS